MPRIARVVIPGVPHHVTQRANRGEEVFTTDSDRHRYLALLRHYALKHGLAVNAYCLMSNHVHLVVVPRDAESLAAALKPVHLRYAQEYNQQTGQNGVVWQGRYYSCPLDERHFWTAVRYVELNPVRAGFVRKAESYPWSSAAAHCGRHWDPLVSGEIEKGKAVDDWAAWLAEGDDKEETASIRSCTKTGRPAGGKEFVSELEAVCGRRLRAMRRGRPQLNRDANHY